MAAMVRGILNRQKLYVSVEAVFDEEGAVKPTAVVLEDGRRYEVDRVLDARRASSLKVGGTNTRCTARIGNSTTYLFYENPAGSSSRNATASSQDVERKRDPLARGGL